MNTSLSRFVQLFGIAALVTVMAGCAEMKPGTPAGARASAESAATERERGLPERRMTPWQPA